ncbi:MAG: hypothetical protein ACYC6W_12540 [Nitrosotalea sp.]
MNTINKDKEEFEEWKADYERWQERRVAIRKENSHLIEMWRSIPWWQFWKRPSFEEQRDIIIGNWKSLEK